MKKILLLLVLVVGLISTTSAQQSSQEWGQPLLVLTETNPWLMVIGSDVPSFALYEGGQIIYRKSHKNGNRYYYTNLAKEQQQELLSELLVRDELLQLPERTIASRATDQPTNELVINFDTLLVKRVYGNLRNDNKAREKTPAAFLKIYDKLIDFEDKQASEWLPEKIEVLVTDYHHSPEKPLKWPSSWPSLKSPDTVWRSEKLYSLYLDKKHFKELLNLMDRLKEKQAVEINGKKFSISYRLPFPNI